MTDRHETISPLNQCMRQEMRLRKLSPNTQSSHLRQLKRSAGFRCILMPANRNGPPIPYPHAPELCASP